MKRTPVVNNDGAIPHLDIYPCPRNDLHTDNGDSELWVRFIDGEHCVRGPNGDIAFKRWASECESRYGCKGCDGLRITRTPVK